jgi:hypothetical protein
MYQNGKYTSMFSAPMSDKTATTASRSAAARMRSTPKVVIHGEAGAREWLNPYETWDAEGVTLGHRWVQAERVGVA